MLQVSQTNIHREQLKPENQQTPQYKQVNAYTQRPALEQILAIIIFITIVAMHAVFITSATVTLQSPILWVLVSVTYGFLIVMLYDYVYLTCNDPADDLLLNVANRYKGQESIDCQFCKRKVQLKSFHCHTCRRCVEEFDHHCKYLNNCIGGKNYANFIRLLMTVTFFCLSVICEGIWVIIVAKSDQKYKARIISEWGALATLILAFIVLLAVDSLLFFHFYLIFQLKTTTLEYIRKGWYQSQRQQDRTKDQKRQIS